MAELIRTMRPQIVSIARNFPYSSARLKYWVYLLTDENLQRIDGKFILQSMLATYIYILDEYMSVERNVRRAEDELGPIPSVLKDIERSLLCIFFVNKLYNLYFVLKIIWNTPTLSSMVLVALDLWIELTMVYLAKVLGIILVALFMHQAFRLRCHI